MDNVEEVQKLRSKIITRVELEEGKEIIKVIHEQIKVYKESKTPMEEVGLYIIGVKESGILPIKVIKGKIIKEDVENSYKHYLRVKEEDIRYIICVKYTQEYGYEASECTKEQIQLIECGRAKKMYYGVTDGRRVEKVLLRETDIKGIEEKDLKEMIQYTFNKRTETKTKKIQSYLLSYT